MILNIISSINIINIIIGIITIITNILNAIINMAIYVLRFITMNCWSVEREEPSSTSSTPSHPPLQVGWLAIMPMVMTMRRMLMLMVAMMKMMVT